MYGLACSEYVFLLPDRDSSQKKYFHFSILCHSFQWYYKECIHTDIHIHLMSYQSAFCKDFMQKNFNCKTGDISRIKLLRFQHRDQMHINKNEKIIFLVFTTLW